MKKLRLVSTIIVFAIAGFIIAVPQSPAKPAVRPELLYSFDMTKLNASTGEVLYTAQTMLETEAQLKADAASESENGVAVLIGTDPGSTGVVTDIQIVGIGGVAFGNIVPACPEEK